MPTQVPAAIGYLVTLFAGAATVGGAGVNVIDGPKVTADPGNLALWVGVDDIESAAPAAASSRQSREGLARKAVEDFTVPCVAQAKAGTDDVASLRTAAAGIVTAAETVVAGDQQLGGTVSSATPGATAEWRQGPIASGFAVRVVFTIDCKALPEP